VTAEGIQAHARQDEGPTARRRLERLQFQLAADRLQLPDDLHVPSLQVDVFPSQAGGLTEPQPASKGTREERPKPVFLGSSQEAASVLDGQRRDRTTRCLGNLDRLRRIDRNQLQFDGVTERGSQDGVCQFNPAPRAMRGLRRDEPRLDHAGRERR
jgi:hypothetical protein